jgi:hypothetical protein
VRHLVNGHDGFRLRADVDEELLAIGAHDDTLDDIAAPPLAVRLFMLGEPVSHRL